MTAYSQVDPKTNLVLRIHFFWRILFAILAAAGAVYIWVGGMETALWQKILISVALAMASIFSAIGAVQISRRNHSGRMISLVLDYLAFVVCFVLMLNTGEIFIGIDALAETFPKGIPYLGITVVGYFLSIMDEYLPQKKQTSENSLKVVGRWVMLAGFAIFLLQVDAINGIIYFLGKLGQPLGIASVIGAIIFGVSIWSMMRDNVSQALHAKTDHEQVINGWLFLSPNLLGFLIFFAGPLILSFYFSFTDSDAFNPPNWIGFENYAKILNVRFAWLSTPDQFAREVVDITV